MAKRAKRSPSAPRVADAIREGILRGAHPAGVKLRQEELAASLGCSVIPLREALHTLHGAYNLISRLYHQIEAFGDGSI